MKTIILQTQDVEGARRHALRHLDDPTVVPVGRLVAIQSPTLEHYPDASLWETARALGLPLLKVVERDPLDMGARRLRALPDASP